MKERARDKGEGEGGKLEQGHRLTKAGPRLCIRLCILASSTQAFEAK